MAALWATWMEAVMITTGGGPVEILSREQDDVAKFACVTMTCFSRVTRKQFLIVKLDPE